ncbi:hypothetical protein DPEC_G00286250 [Dallia pectoralis]|uniref:Uncharacterized protein n=1 Tax=Dallia pectoralis TaxID=75939 RepID=A0ACC2FK17_DALPE|nr:hypothetical protein DPEC_G00286250 [Dallia pectoralis]
MDEQSELADEYDCPNLLCEEQETEDEESDHGDESGRRVAVEGDNWDEGHREERGRKHEGKVVEEAEERKVTDSFSMTTTAHEDSGYLSSGISFYCPSGPVLFPTQPPPQPQPVPHQGVKRPHSVSPPPPATQNMQVKVTRVYSTRRSIRYNTRGRGQVPLPLLPAVTMGDTPLLPPLTKKKTRTLYSTDQLEQLEGLFQEEHYPDGEKRKEMAAMVGVTPQRIMVWFQNRRAKWRKAGRSTIRPEQKQTCTSSQDVNPNSNPNPLLAPQPDTRMVPGQIVPFPPPPPGVSLPLPPATQALPSYSNLLASLSSSPTGRTRGGGEVGQGLVEHLSPVMYSPPPLRRASLPLLATFLNPPTSTPPPPTPTTTPTSPLFIDVLESNPHIHPPGRSTQGLSLQTDTGTLFDYSSAPLATSSVKVDPQHYLTSSHQGGATVSYQLQTQPSRLAYLTPSPYLTPKPPEGNALPNSYLTFGPGCGPGVVTYGAGGHTYFQTQPGGGQILLQSGIHGGITAYQPYSWDQMYSQPAVFQQRNQCSQLPASTVGGRDPSSSYPLAPYYPRSHTQPQRTTHTLAQVLPPASSLRFPHPRGAVVPQPRRPTTPLDSLDPQTMVKAETESPPQIHSSHFHCDFSPILF